MILARNLMNPQQLGPGIPLNIVFFNVDNFYWVHGWLEVN
jgi:hypothetical protein